MGKNWQVKELSNLTGVSVRMLHHYDKLGLLKPSIRKPNGYRIYTENDLVKLQLIIALRFLGFGLAEIRRLLQKDAPAVDHFKAQATLMRDKIHKMQQASSALEGLIFDFSKNKNVPWEKLVKSIEGYKMIDKMKDFKKNYSDSLGSKMLSPEKRTEMEEYLAKTSPEELAKNAALWGGLINVVAEAKINRDGNDYVTMKSVYADAYAGDFSKDYGNEQYNAVRDSLRRAKEMGCSVQSPEYMGDMPIFNLFAGRCLEWMKKVQDNLDEDPKSELAKKRVGYWTDTLDQMFGDDKKERAAFVEKITPIFGKEVMGWLGSALKAQGL